MENLDKCRKARTVLRAAFTKQYNTASAKVLKKDCDKTELRTVLQLLEVKHQELLRLNTQIFETLLCTNYDEEELSKEMETNDEYSRKYNVIIEKCKILLVNEDAVSQNEGSVTLSKSFKLPKIELKKFNGDLKE